MGLENRDYVRSDRGGSGGGYRSYGYMGDNWAIKYIIAANVAVFVLQMVSQQPGAVNNVITDYLSLSLQDLERFQIWRLVTYGFCHSTFSLTHILFNMFVLWMFGRLVEPVYGSREFFAFYIVGIVVSGLCHVGLQLITHIPSVVIGASGGVNAVVFLCAMLYPRMTVLFMFVIPIEFRFLAVGYALMDLFGVFNQASVIAHAAHLGGAAFGVAYKYFNWRITPWLDPSNWLPKRRPRSNPNIHAYRPPAESRDNLDSRVDEILTKIQKQGEASLTDEERQILKEASQKYKNR